MFNQRKIFEDAKNLGKEWCFLWIHLGEFHYKIHYIAISAQWKPLCFNQRVTRKSKWFYGDQEIGSTYLSTKSRKFFVIMDVLEFVGKIRTGFVFLFSFFRGLKRFLKGKTGCYAFCWNSSSFISRKHIK